MLKPISLLLCLLALTSVASAAPPTRNGTGGKTTFAATTVVNTSVITVAAGSNTVLIVGITGQGGMSGVSCNWDQAGTPQAMTVIGVGTNNGVLPTLFGLRLPHVGNLQLQCTWSGTVGGFVGGQAYDGVNIVSDVNAFQNQAHNSGNSTVDTLNIVNVTGGVVIDIAASSQSFGNTGTQATLLFDNSGAAAGVLGEQFGAGTLTDTWSITPSGVWSDQGVSLAPVPSSAGGGRNLMMMGQ